MQDNVYFVRKSRHTHWTKNTTCTETVIGNYNENIDFDTTLLKYSSSVTGNSDSFCFGNFGVDLKSSSTVYRDKQKIAKLKYCYR